MPRLETHHLAWTMLVVAAIGGGTLLGNRSAQPRPRLVRPSVECSAMKGHRVAVAQIALPTSGAVVSDAVLQPAVAAPADRPADGLPEYRSLTGTIAPVDPAAPNITFRLNIPTAWNGKAWQVGGGGSNGVIPANLAAMARRGSPVGASYPPDLPSPLAQGYAMYGSDSGHQGSGFGPGRGGAGAADTLQWILNDEAWTNFAYAQLKKTHDVAMRLMEAMYGSRARVSYFGGESQGGREALEVVSRYPSDYDGVIAVVPLAYFAGLLIDPTVKGVAQLSPDAWVPPAKAAAIRAETLRLCDALDGLADGVINDYNGCNRRLDPAQTETPLAGIMCKGGGDTGNDCLSRAQMKTVDMFHAEERFGYPLANGEQTWPGWGTGLEGPNGWLLSNVQPDTANAGAFNAGLGTTLQRARLARTQEFNLLTLDVEKVQGSDPGDLRRGGRPRGLDPLLPPQRKADHADCGVGLHLESACPDAALRSPRGPARPARCRSGRQVLRLAEREPRQHGRQRQRRPRAPHRRSDRTDPALGGERTGAGRSPDPDTARDRAALRGRGQPAAVPLPAVSEVSRPGRPEPRLELRLRHRMTSCSH